jgi:hypothetical protein
MARFIPPHPAKGSAAAQAWAKKMREARLAKKIRRAGMKAEEKLFGPSGEFMKSRRRRLNPMKAADYLTAKGWTLSVGTRTQPKVFSKMHGGYLLVLQQEAQGWRLLTEHRAIGQHEPVSIGVFPLLPDAVMRAERVARKNPGAAWHEGAAEVAKYRGRQQLEPIAKALYKGMQVAHEDSARAAKRLMMNPSAIPAIDSPIYNEKVRFPKYSVKVSPISAYGSDGVKLLLRRLPGWTKGDHQAAAQHHVNMAAQTYASYQRVLAEAETELKRRGLDAGPLVSGIVSDRFPETVKNQLRAFAWDTTRHKTAAWLHDRAAHSRMVPGARTRSNPIAVYNPPKISGIIYKKAIEIRAQKTDRLAGHYKHTFGPKVQILGLDNGDVLLHHVDGKPLWITKKAYDRQNRHR